MEEIVAYLSFSEGRRDPLPAFQKFTRRQWKHVLQWMDDAGLAFYFLQKLKHTNASDVIPPSVLSQLQRNFTSNQLRVHYMSRRFDAINGRFTDAGMHYVVLKGFSLVPQFCPYAALRHQGDFDYLVDEQSLPAASRILIDERYKPQDSRSSTQTIFVSPGGEPSRNGQQYSPQAPHAVELHTDIWDSTMHRVPSIPCLFSTAQARTHNWNGIRFPAQTDADAFLLQVLHTCHHLFGQWVRMSCLYEIGYFLQRRAWDNELWGRIEQRARDSAILREFVVIVAGMVNRLFAAPVPELVQSWGARTRPGPRIWTEHYARSWALDGLPVFEFSLFPRAKLALFLHQEYRSASWVEAAQPQSEAPSSRLSRIVSSVKRNPTLALNPSWWKHQHLFRRALFHGLAGLRYVCEIPRWKWRNRAYARSASAAWTGDSSPAKRAS